MSDKHDTVVAQLRQETNPALGRPPWTTVSGLCGSLHTDIDPDQVECVLAELERDDTPEGRPTVARFEDGHDQSVTRLVLLEESRMAAVGRELAKDPEEARHVLRQLADEEPVPKQLVGAINSALIEVTQ